MDSNAHTYTERFDANGDYHAVLDGHAVTIPCSAIITDSDDDAILDLDAAPADERAAAGSDGRQLF